MANLRKNKKGSALDLIFIGSGLLAFAVVVLISFMVYTNFNAEIQTHSDVPAQSKTASQAINDFYPGFLDNSFLFLAIGLTLVSFALAALVRVHPIFIPLFIISLIFIIFFCGIFSNIYQGMAENAQLQTYADQLTFISLIMEFLPFIVGILGSVLMVIMYKLGQDAQIG